MSDFDDLLRSTAAESGEPTTGRAEMARQEAASPSASFNLDAMWRAAGCPAGDGPGDWAEMAMPLIAAVTEYLIGINERRGWGHGRSIADFLAQYHEGSLAMPILGRDQRAGDLMATYSIAIHYARYLDRGTVMG